MLPASRGGRMKKIVIAAVTGLALTGGFVVAGKPVRNVSPGRQPNLAAAQRLAREAVEKIAAAQGANEWDMNGDGQKAQELVDQVKVGLKEGAKAAHDDAP